MNAALMEASDPSSWDRFVATASDGSILQSWAWGELKAQYGWRPTRYSWMRDGRVHGAVSVLRRPLPGGFAMHYAPHGPVLDGQLREWPALWSALRRELSLRGGSVLKVDPQWPTDDAWILEKTGARQARPVQHQATAMIDLNDGEDVFGRMSASARRNMREAERAGVVVESSVELDDVDRLYDLLMETAGRQHFIVHSPGYYRNLFQAFMKDARIYLATHQGSVVAGSLFITYGPRLVYLFSGSNDEGRQLKAPYLIQQKAIRDAQVRGCSSYDLWGIPLEAAPGQAGWGYAHFKAMLGGRPIRFAGAWDLPVHRPLAVAYHLAERLVARPMAVA